MQQSNFFRHFKISQAQANILWAIWKSVVTKSSISHISIECRWCWCMTGRMSTFCPGGDRRQATWEIFLSLDISEGALKCHTLLCPCCIADTVSDIVRCQETPPVQMWGKGVSNGSNVIRFSSNDGSSVLARCLASVARWSRGWWHVLPRSLNRRPPALLLSRILFRIPALTVTYNPK